MTIYLHVTEVINFCPKKFWFKINSADRSPKHVYSVRGTLVHKVIEKFLTGYIDSIDDSVVYDIAREYNLTDVLNREIHRKYVLDSLSNFVEWYNVRLKPDIDTIKLDIEKNIEISFGDIVLTGTPDLIIWNGEKGVIVDFKTGKKHTKEHELQLVGYVYMLDNSGSIYTKPIKLVQDVYLGNSRYREVSVSYFDVRYREFKVILDDVIKQAREIIANKDRMPEGVLNNMCIFCDYRGVCDGV